VELPKSKLSKEPTSRVLCFTDCFLLVPRFTLSPENGGSKFLQHGEFLPYGEGIVFFCCTVSSRFFSDI
jgi:hypothetical protein